MLAKLLCFPAVAASHIMIGIFFYKLRVTNPRGMMRHDFAAFILPLLLAALGYFLITIRLPVLQKWTATPRILAIIFIALGVAVVFQVIAMTISANLYGT